MRNDIECIIRKQSPRYSNRQFGVSTFEPFQLELPFPPAAAFQYRSDGPALPEAKMYFLLAKTHGMTWVKQCFIFSMGNPLLGELKTGLTHTTYIYIYGICSSVVYKLQNCEKEYITMEQQMLNRMRKVQQTAQQQKI